jgi:hypothetical protein
MRCEINNHNQEAIFLFRGHVCRGVARRPFLKLGAQSLVNENEPLVHGRPVTNRETKAELSVCGRCRMTLNGPG